MANRRGAELRDDLVGKYRTRFAVPLTHLRHPARWYPLLDEFRSMVGSETAQTRDDARPEEEAERRRFRKVGCGVAGARVRNAKRHSHAG